MDMKTFAKLIQSGDLSRISSAKNITSLATSPIIGHFNTDITEFTNPSPIQLATVYNKEDIVEYFLKLGSDPNYIGKANDFTPLHIAIIQCNLSIVQLLLDNDAAINIDDAFGLPTIFSAVRWSTSDIMLQILSRDPCKDKKYNGNNALHFAVSEKKQEHAVLLVAFGYDPQEPNQKGQSAIDIAKEMKLTNLIPQLNIDFAKSRLSQMPQVEIGRRRVQPLEQDTEPDKPKEKKAQEKQNQQKPKPNIITSMPRDEYVTLQRRVQSLEQIVTRLLPKYADSKLFKPQICFTCNSKKGLNICPVCGHSFCDEDFYIHVSQGCKLE